MNREKARQIVEALEGADISINVGGKSTRFRLTRLDTLEFNAYLERTRWLRSAIKRICRVNGWKMFELANHLNIQKSAVSHYFTGRREPTEEIREQIRRLDERAGEAEAGA
jgi:hypothetical protein